MISDLSSPISLGSAPRYEVMKNGHNAGNRPENRELGYHWRVVSASGELIHEEKTRERSIHIPTKVMGGIKVSVDILWNGIPTGQSLEMVQEVVDERDKQEGAGVKPFIYEVPERSELANELRDYVLDAAAATGPNGISARFLAAVLLTEIRANPKEEREGEIERAEDPIRDMSQGNWKMPWESENRELGVGQIDMSRAAMVEGLTPWVNQDGDDESAGPQEAHNNYDQLDAATKADLFELLRWPKTNIQVAANFLAMLKNRPNRYPEMTKAEFGQDERAMSVVATEYKLGGSDSAEQDAKIILYGKWANEQMRYTFVREHFPNE